MISMAHLVVLLLAFLWVAYGGLLFFGLRMALRRISAKRRAQKVRDERLIAAIKGADFHRAQLSREFGGADGNG